jgi:hypothetical protein
MRELIERLEKATGPDRELDYEIFKMATSGNYWPEHSALWFQTGFTRKPIAFTASIDAAVALVKATLPGWGYRIATCCVSDDAAVWPDFNCATHGKRLREEFDETRDWFATTDVDLRPPGRPAIALCISVLLAKEAIAQQKGKTI